MLLEPSTAVGSARYEITGTIESGGPRAVYEARDLQTGQRVALVALVDASNEAATRMVQAERALADAGHPNLVSVEALIEEDGLWLVVMKLADDRAAPHDEAAIEVPFTGREAELQILERALAQTHEGSLRMVLIEGESGVGKSELVAQFLRRAEASHASLLALRGACFESELVPYKAFQGAIDALAEQLKRLSAEDCATLLPERGALLGQLFPTLRGVKSIAKSSRAGLSADPTARRIEAFGAVAALLGKLADEWPVVIAIDDLQWADVASFQLLSALLDAEQVPPILLLATIRPRNALAPEVLAQVNALRQRSNTGVVELLGLPSSEAFALAEKRLGRGVPAAQLDTLARESEGHPLWLSELVRVGEGQERAFPGQRKLDDALRARIERQPGPARALLELAAIAERPYERTIFARALGVADVDGPAELLIETKLLGTARGKMLGCHRDSVRRAAIALVPRGRQPALHRALAEALLSAPQADPCALALHWDLAGDVARACEAYERAADRVLDTLAFARAEQLYARALALLDDADGARRQRMTVQRAEALAAAGQSGEAAALYQAAAEHAERAERLQLRARAAKQLVLSARLQPGLALVRELLWELGYKLPERPLAQLVRWTWDTLCVAVRRLPRRLSGRDVPRDPGLPLTQELLDTLASVDPRTYLLVLMQAVRRALGSTHPLDVIKALTWRGWYLALSGSRAAAGVLFTRARSLADGQADVHTSASLDFVEGSSLVVANEWLEAVRRLAPAERLLHEGGSGYPLLHLFVRYHLGLSWFHLGEHARLARELGSWLAEARARNDALAEALLTGAGYGFVRHLMNDAPAEALKELDDALAPLPNRPYSFAQLGHFFARGLVRVYAGGDDALRFVEAAERLDEDAYLLAVGEIRAWHALMHGWATLSAAVAATGRARAELLKRGRQNAKKLERARGRFVRASADLMIAQLDALAGRSTRALQRARAARLALEQLQHGYRHAARHLEGLLEGGERGRDACAAAVAALSSQGWRNPQRALALATPLLPLLAPSTSLSLSPSRLLRGRYEIGAPLAGSRGNVVAARDVQRGRTVALKQLTADKVGSLERFKQEFRALQDVPHENLVQIESLFEHQGNWFIAMELIEGEELLRYVRPAGDLEPSRLRSVFLGLIEGLCALHEAGFVHRDVGARNARVTPDGRAVLLDFGRIGRIGDARDATPIGSFEYAAPEQLAGSVPHPSADAYGLAGCLYEALSGRPPFEGPLPQQLLVQKLTQRPVALEIPGLTGVAALCTTMLAAEPAARPSLRALRDALIASEDGTSLAFDTLIPPDDPVHEIAFAGRVSELATLTETFGAAHAHGLTVALIEGESGVGKSALIAEFGRRLRQARPRLRVLISRCYENEQIALKAFDGAAAQLAELLADLPRARVDALLPRRAALLAQLFPVLGGVPSIAHATKRGLPADPTQRQLGARGCLIQLLGNLTSEFELLFIVEDLQWADDESFRLLDALVEHKAKLPYLVVASVRPADQLGDARARAALAALKALPSTRHLLLTGLSEADAGAVIAQLTGSPPSDVRRRRMVAESKGHPLFLRELVEQERRGALETARPLTLDDALRARIQSFEPDARKLLALVALAGKPYSRRIYARALGGRTLPHAAVSALMSNGFLRRSGEDALTYYHDRVRRVALALLSSEQRQCYAHELALALEKDPRADAAERGRLWDEAGERARAVAAYEQAGDRALASLAFAPAAQHYTRALSLRGEARDDGWLRLTMQRGHAHARAGDSADAARDYTAAAETAPSELQVRLRVWAAQHLIQSGAAREGRRAAAKLLADIGESMPHSEQGALLRIAIASARLRLRGLSLGRPTRPISAEARLALEALRDLAPLLTAMSPLGGMALVLRFLRRALDAGDPELAARALANGAMWQSIRAPQRDQTAHFELSRRLADEVNDPLLIAQVELDWGVACLQNRLPAAVVHLSTAHELLLSRCPGEPWVLTTARMNLGLAWSSTGDFEQVVRASSAWLDEARARNDKYALAALCGLGGGAFRFILPGRSDEALAELAEVMAPWADLAFSHLHFGAFLQTAAARMADGDATTIAWLDRENAQLRGEFYMRVPTCRLHVAKARISALLLTLADRRDARRRDLVGQARREVQAIAKNPSRLSRGVATLSAAVLDALSDRPEQALTGARAARTQLREVGSYMAPGALFLEGYLEGGEDGRDKCARVLRSLEAQGFTNPRRGLAIHLPGAHLFV